MDVDTAIGKLQRSVQALVDGDLLLATDGGSLLAQLETARRHLRAGNTAAAQTGMQAFVDLVQALMQGSAFGWEDGGPQIDAARTILGWLRPAGRGGTSRAETPVPARRRARSLSRAKPTCGDESEEEISST